MSDALDSPETNPDGINPSPGHPGWRVILTDSEAPTGIAPVCPYAATNHYLEDEDGAPYHWIDVHGVYDCCPHPHIECGTPSTARQVAELLTAARADVIAVD
jgi:hypothetical protein